MAKMARRVVVVNVTGGPLLPCLRTALTCVSVAGARALHKMEGKAGRGAAAGLTPEKPRSSPSSWLLAHVLCCLSLPAPLRRSDA